MNDILTSEVLDLAGDAIQRQGWRKGPGGWDSTPAGLCLEGAILAAQGRTWNDTTLYAQWTSPAYQAVGEFLNMNTSVPDRFGQPREYLWEYNDFIATDADEVVAVLRAAAAVERAKEAVAGYDKEDQELPLDVAA